MEKNMYSQEKIIKERWKKFINGDTIEKEVTRPVILESWERCRKNKVDPYRTKAPIVYRKAGLNKHLNKYSKLINISSQVMESIYSFAENKHFILVLTDNQGCILKTMGDEKLKKIGETANLIPGALWSEEKVGTNAIGTSLFLDKPIQVLGHEHYRLGSKKFSCSAAPIHDSSGKIIGILNITWFSNEAFDNSFSMIVTTANAIEAQIKLENTIHSLEISNKLTDTIADSVSEGLLMVDNSDHIISINRIMTHYLGINMQKTANSNIYSLLGPKNNTLKNIISNRQIVTDHEIELFSSDGKNKTNCLVTSRIVNNNTANNDTVWEGMVILFNENSQQYKQVHSLSSDKADFTFSDLIGKNPRFLETVKLARKASETSSNILLLGESGTGKDAFAQAIHNRSTRKKKPFIPINCGAIPRELIASELFGYAEGAFTGAKHGGKLGKFEVANGGTIFLDEIGEMPLDLQTSLLRVLETKTITRIGGNKVIPVDVRIIAATNKDLVAEVNQGRFRPDLFYRLNVFTIQMVPLRERKHDIPLLVEHILEKLCLKFRKPSIHVDKKVLEILSNYSWPGNIRELQNVLERALNLCNDTVLTVDFLPPEVKNLKTPKEFMPIKNYERELIKQLLQKHNRNITRVAKEMGIARTTLYNKISKYNL